MITQAVYSVHSLPLGTLTEFFVNRGIETLSPAGFYAIRVFTGLPASAPPCSFS